MQMAFLYHNPSTFSYHLFLSCLRSAEKQVEGTGGRLAVTIEGVAAGGSTHEEDDNGSLLSLPEDFPETHSEDQITMLLELTRTMR